MRPRQRPRQQADAGEEPARHDRERTEAIEPVGGLPRTQLGVERPPAEGTHHTVGPEGAGEVPEMVGQCDAGGARQHDGDRVDVAPRRVRAGRHQDQPAGKRDAGGVDERGHEHDQVGVLDEPGGERLERLRHTVKEYCKARTTHVGWTACRRRPSTCGAAPPSPPPSS